jgi:uncharacterized protein YdaU (DUF1376 family)
MPVVGLRHGGRFFLKTMAKDPAVLFYTSDFLTGTMFMTDEQVGVYIRLLCAQHQHGGRIDTNVLRSYCERITGGDTVYAKFKHDERGSFSSRLEKEMNLRAEKSEKARVSVQKRWEKQNTSEAYERNTNVIRSESENESENESEDREVGGMGEGEKVTRRFKAPTLSDVSEFMSEKNMIAGGAWPDAKVNAEAKAYWNYYQSNGWMVGRVKMKDWRAAARSWMNRTFEKENSKPKYNGKPKSHNRVDVNPRAAFDEAFAAALAVDGVKRANEGHCKPAQDQP